MRWTLARPPASVALGQRIRQNPRPDGFFRSATFPEEANGFAAAQCHLQSLLDGTSVAQTRQLLIPRPGQGPWLAAATRLLPEVRGFESYRWKEASWQHSAHNSRAFTYTIKSYDEE